MTRNRLLLTYLKYGRLRQCVGYEVSGIAHLPRLLAAALPLRALLRTAHCAAPLPPPPLLFLAHYFLPPAAAPRHCALPRRFARRRGIKALHARRAPLAARAIALRAASRRSAHRAARCALLRAAARQPAP